MTFNIRFNPFSDLTAMQTVLEKLRRKGFEALYKTGVWNPAPFVTATQVSMPSLENRPLIWHCYAYHFVQPEEIKTDFIFNSEGIPVRMSQDSRNYQNPLCAAYWGLIHANQYYSEVNQDDAKQMVVRMADHLLSVGRLEGPLLCFDYHIDLPAVSLKSPWISGIAQALATSLFFRVYDMTSREEYRNAAIQSARVMITGTEEGGVWGQTTDGIPWVEEYPGSKLTHVLNGCLFALIALMECVQMKSDEFTRGMHQIYQSVLAIYPRFRVRPYLLYDLRLKHFCSPHYMGLHVLLFYHLWKTSGDRSFLDIARELHKDTDWPKYMQSINHSMTLEDKAWIEKRLLAIGT